MALCSSSTPTAAAILCSITFLFGPGAFPWCVAPLLRSTQQAFFLVPTREQRERDEEERDADEQRFPLLIRFVSGQREQGSDPRPDQHEREGAKDRNRPYLMMGAFANDAVLEVNVRTRRW